MKFSANAIIFLGALPAVYAQSGKSTKSAKATPSPVTAAPVAAGKSTKASKSSKVTAAPVSSAPVSTSPVSTSPVSSAPVSTSPVSFAPFTATPSASPVTSAPFTATPSASPVTSAPSAAPATSSPSASPVTSVPSASPVTSAPSASPVTSAPSASPTTAPPTSAPSTSPTLSFTPVGLGECVDGNNNVFSQFGLQLGVNATAAECNAACSTSFYDADLVGFGTKNFNVESCYCYYSGGITPSIIPPQNYYYIQYPHAGNGPIMSTKSRAGWDCFVYAKGTGSPTSPGATNAPISPSPTGSITSAPTPTGIATFSPVGDGYCVASNNVLYPWINGFIYGGTTSCAQFCGEFASPDLVGFAYDPTPGNAASCFCYFNYGRVPPPPLGSNWHNIYTTNQGTGPIKTSTGTNNGAMSCYAFPQGTASPAAAPALNLVPLS